MKKGRKAFTVIELVIVIAIIGILAAVLIPTFISLTNKANRASDDSLVKNLNTALKMAEAEQGKGNDTYQDAIDDLKDYGYLLPNLVTKSDYKLLYNIEKNEFCLNDKTEAGIPDVDYWAIENSMPETQKYSIYPGPNFNLTSIDGLHVGFDAGEEIEFTTINYDRSSATEGQSVVIRTNSLDTTLNINAPLDTVKHYGEAGSVNIVTVAGESYHENGKVAFLEVKNGRVALERKAEVAHIHLDVTGTGSSAYFNDITIAKANSVRMPEFSRDPVEIPSQGKLIVALQEGTADPSASKEYVWLTAVGIYEQATLGSESSAGNNYVATSSASSEKKEAAQQIANVINASVLGYDYVVKAERDGDNWSYTLVGETEAQTAIVSSYDISVNESTSVVTVMNGTIPVASTTTVDNGVDVAEKEAIKTKTINDEKGTQFFTASIQDIGANYYLNYEYLEVNSQKEIDIDYYSIGCDIDTDIFGVSWVSSDDEIADATVTAYYMAGFDEYTQEEYDELSDEDKADCEVEYEIVLNAKSTGGATIVITYYDLSDPTNSTDYTYNVFVTETQVKIGETVYPTIEAAVAAAQNGDTISLFKDIGLNTLYIDTGYLPGVTYGHGIPHTEDNVTTYLAGVKTLTLDLNGYSINASALQISNTNLTIVDSSNNKTGVINAIVYYSFVGNSANLTWNPNKGVYETTSITYSDPTSLTLKNGTIKEVSLWDHTILVVDGARVVNNAEIEPNVSIFAVGSGGSLSDTYIEVKSGVVYGTQYDIKAVGANNTVVITGGAFKYDPSDLVYLEQYNVAPNEDGTLWIVSAK